MMCVYDVDIPVGCIMFEITLQVPTQVTEDGQFVLFVLVVTLPDPGV